MIAAVLRERGRPADLEVAAFSDTDLRSLTTNALSARSCIKETQNRRSTSNISLAASQLSTWSPGFLFYEENIHRFHVVGSLRSICRAGRNVIPHAECWDIARRPDPVGPAASATGGLTEGSGDLIGHGFTLAPPLSRCNPPVSSIGAWS
jgi:hypothetical protein